MGVNSWVCDFETLTTNTKYYKKFSKTMVILGCLLNMKNDKKYIFYSINEFWDIILNLKNNSYIYFHNLTFDGDFILSSLKDFKELDIKTFRYNNIVFDIDFFMINNSIYNIIIKKDDIIINIKCSLKLLTSSVENLGKIINIDKFLPEQKIKNNFYDIEPEEVKNNLEFIEYCFRDCVIVKTSLNNFFKELKAYKKDVKYENKNTAGGLATALLKYETDFKQITNNLFISYEDYKYFSNFYKGGFTQYPKKIFGKIQKNLNGCCYDLNSSYPAVMVEPLPLIETNKPNKYTTSIIEIKIKKAIIKDEFKEWRLIKNPIKNGERYINSNLEDLTLYYFEDELNTIKKFFKVFEYDIINQRFFILKKAFDHTIKNLYKLKSDPTKNKETYKVLLNSLYGQLALKPNYEIPFLTYKNLKIGDIVNDNFKVLRQKENRYTKSNLYVVQEIIKDDFNKCKNNLIAGYITSKARIKLFNAIYDNPNNVLYVDTDSLYFADKNKINFNNINVDDKKLGFWKDEHKYFDNFLCLGPKKYLYGDSKNKKINSKFGGLKQREMLHKRYLNSFEFDNLLNDDLTFNSKRVKRVDGGIIIEEFKKQFKPKNN